MEEKKEIELRSDEVQEILTSVPHWIVRWGNLLILWLIVMLFVLSWYIKYPDIVSAQITITTQVPPQKLVARSAGSIQKIFVENNSNVVKGQALAVIENSADQMDVLHLKSIVDSLEIGSFGFPFPFDRLSLLQLGEVQPAYMLFEKDYNAYRLNRDLKPYAAEGEAQGKEIGQVMERLSLLNRQREISEKEMGLKRKELERYRKLFEKGIISAQDWEQKNLSYMEFERGAAAVSGSISQLASSLIDLRKNSKTTTINEAKDDLSLYRNAVQSLGQLKKAISDWELAYVFRTSTEGKVSFMQVWTENQTVGVGEEVFTVIPQNRENYVGKVKAELQNSGKLRAGQRVNIRLANYPDREFGTIRGKVVSISSVPDKDGKLLLDIELPHGIRTSYDKDIIFHQEMIGTADIVTEDLRLLERFFYQFRSVLDR